MSPTIKPFRKKWTQGRTARYLASTQHLGPEWMLAKISRTGGRWWALDDILIDTIRETTPDGNAVWVAWAGEGYHYITQAAVEEARRRLGKDADRLELRALPSLDDIAPRARVKA